MYVEFSVSHCGFMSMLNWMYPLPDICNIIVLDSRTRLLDAFSSDVDSFTVAVQQRPGKPARS
jgi:hypothetical protein